MFAWDVHQIVAGDGECGHRAAASRDMQQDQCICVVPAFVTIASVKLVENLRRERIAVWALPRVQTDQQHIGCPRERRRFAEYRLRGRSQGRDRRCPDRTQRI